MGSDGSRWRGGAVDYKSSFHAVLATVRPLMKGTRNLGEFTAGLIDMGLVPRGTVDGEKTALEMRKSATWKGYANGSDQLPTVLASELAGRWDQFRFASNVSQAYEESALNDLADRLHDLDESINKGNVTEGLGQLFYKVFTEAAGETAAVTEPLTLADKADRSGVPYIDEKTNRLRLGDRSVALPQKHPTPDTVQSAELGYVSALLAAYCEDKARTGVEVQLDDIPSRLVQHFQEQRKAFYRAEWVRETSWNCIHDGRPLFDEFLETMHAGVSDTNLRQYPNGLERLLATLAQAAAVQLDGVRLDQIIDLIDVWSRKGSCHELVARKRLGWVD